ncbi:MAG: 4Fe-4S binding protein [Candidatus Kariarchaeaceae archaeon]
MRQGSGSGQGRGGKGRGAQGGQGYGSGGFCFCTSCQTKVSHQRGQPCYSLKCPDCGSEMAREANISTQKEQPKIIEAKAENNEIPVIDQEICKGCMICARYCPEGAIQRVNGYAVINPEICTNCKNCVASCPLDAIN